LGSLDAAGSGPDGLKSFPVLALLTGNDDRFLADKWGRSFHLALGVADALGGPLLSLNDFASLAAERGLRAPVPRIVKDGRSVAEGDLSFDDVDASVPVPGLLRPELVSEAAASGHTVVLRNLQHFHPPLRRFCRTFELELNHPVQANAYLTPGGAGGLAVHHDHHDVFVVQTHGAKEWELYEAAVKSPVDPWDYEKDRPGPRTGAVTTNAGDCLYLARGIPHGARAGTAPSLHVTLGVRSRNWLDVIHALVDGAAGVEAFRQSLAPGYADDPAALRAQLLDRLGLLPTLVADGEFVEDVTASFWWRRRPPLDGHLLDILDIDRLAPETVVKWRSDHVGRVAAAPEGFELRLWDRVLDFEERHRPALYVLMEGGPVAVADVDARLPLDERLLLVRRLVEAGVVRVVRPA